MGKKWKQWQILFSSAPKSLWMVPAARKLKDTCFLEKKKTLTNLDSVLKSRDIILQPIVHIVKAVIFPVIMYGYESWTIKKAELWGIDAFKLWYWRRVLIVFWKARWSNQSILKDTSPEYPLEGLMLKLKLQYVSHLIQRWQELTHWKRWWCWARLKAGGEGSNRGWESWMAHSVEMRFSKLKEIVKDREDWYAAVHGSQSQTWLSDWTTIAKNNMEFYVKFGNLLNNLCNAFQWS